MTQLSARVLELAAGIQQIPAPTFHEEKRGRLVRDLFAAEGLADVSMDALGNVYAHAAGRARGSRPLVVSAHLDTVFPENIDLKIRKDEGKVMAPGIGDNSLGVAALFGIHWALQGNAIEPDGDLWLVANVGEEGLGDLRGMRAVVDRFGRDVVGYLVLEGLALGQIYHRAVGVERRRIRAITAGGHSWSDYGQPSAIHELAELITRITSIHLPGEPRTTMNVGTISGGTGVNVVASESVCELDLRSEDPGVLQRVVDQVEGLLADANREGVEVKGEVIGQRPAGRIPPHHPFVRLALDCTRASGVQAVLAGGSTDANVPLSLGIPAVVMGVTTGGGAHTIHEYIDTGPVERGLNGIVKFVERVGSTGSM